MCLKHGWLVLLQRASLAHSYGNKLFFCWQQMQLHKSLFPFPEILEKSICSSKRSICWAPLQEKRPWSGSDTLTPKFGFVAGRNLSSKFCFRFFKGMGVILSNVVECSFPCGDGFKKNFQILIVLLLAMESNILFSFLVYISLAP